MRPGIENAYRGCVPPTEHRDVFLGFSFDVVRQLVVQFLVRLRPEKHERGRNGIVNRQCSGPSPILLYSYLKATTGSTRVACRAGT